MNVKHVLMMIEMRKIGEITLATFLIIFFINKLKNNKLLSFMIYFQQVETIPYI